jgi:hypothetical protein
MSFSLRDASLQQSAALPNGATSTSTGSIDLGVNASGLASNPGGVLADFEVQIQAPVLATAALPNTDTMTYSIETSPDNSTWTVLYGTALTQTGAGGAGAPAATQNVRLPVGCNRYVRGQATNSGAGNCSGSNFVIALLF